jgi:hypothetical protein
VIGIHTARRAAIAEPVLRTLAAGVRASRRRVGYLGSEAALTVLNAGDPLPGGWSAVWQTNTLVVFGNNVTIDHYRINASVVFQGDNPTMTNCKVYCNADDIFGVTLNGASHGVFTITDTTVVGNASGTNPQVNGISGDAGGLIARRCDVSGTGDGIHMVANADPAKAIISQCYIHDQAFIDEAQHCDGIQIFNGTVTGFFTVEHCFVGKTVSTPGTPMNAGMTCGTATADGSPLATPAINNCYFESGAFHLRLNFQLHNSTVTNNGFGPLDAGAGEFGLATSELAIDTWMNNRDASGNQMANPFLPVAPTIKEALQTTDGQTSVQVLSTMAGLTSAGDTLLVVYATDNNAASAPTSTAGALTQIGTDTTDGNSSGLLRAYTVPVASSGSKDVTIPAAGGFDVMGAVLVLGGPINVEGFTKINFPSSVTSFSTPAATLAGAADLLVSIMYNGQGKTFDLSGSGLTQRANPKCLPFSALCVGTDVLSSAGTSPTFTIGLSGTAKPGVAVFGLQAQ